MLTHLYFVDFTFFHHYSILWHPNDNFLSSLAFICLTIGVLAFVCRAIFLQERLEWFSHIYRLKIFFRGTGLSFPLLCKYYGDIYSWMHYIKHMLVEHEYTTICMQHLSYLYKFKISALAHRFEDMFRYLYFLAISILRRYD